MSFQSRIYSIHPELEKKIDSVLESKYSLHLKDAKKIATSVQKLSDYYIQFAKEKAAWQTPWSESWCQIAYLGYYLPLNSLRAQAVLEEAQGLHFLSEIDNIIDFGSGLGSATLNLHQYLNQNISLVHVEDSPIAQDLHRALGGTGQWQTTPPKISNKTLGIFSYSLTELTKLPDWTFECDSLMIIEPATREQGRKLLTLREELLKKNFQAWAPCTHQGLCPLLHQSKTDWCHDRIHFNQPAWFKAIEAHLPIRNKTITMSYLLLSKRPAPKLSQAARTVGDFLDEKGKSRQLICRGEKREYLSWMHKNITPQEIPRGTLIQWPQSFEEKSNEIRLQEPILKFQLRD